MAFNHYAKLKRILSTEPDGWYVKRINEPTKTQNFKGEVLQYDHYYRLFDHRGLPIKYGKFQQLERFAQTMGMDAGQIVVIEE